MISITSEVGRLKKVLIHSPGLEIERITPFNKDEFLFDDVLYPDIARNEHKVFSLFLESFLEYANDSGTNVKDIRELLRDILELNDVKESIIKEICWLEGVPSLVKHLKSYEAEELSNILIGGLLKKEIRERISRRDIIDFMLGPDDFYLKPIPNMLFARDPAAIVGDKVILSSMAKNARRREPLLLKFIFKYHDFFKMDGEAPEFIFESLEYNPAYTIEGGDIIVISENVLAIGCSERTSPAMIDFISSEIFNKTNIQSIYAVIMPKQRSSMHLDTIFTMIDVDLALIYDPIVLGNYSDSAQVVRIFRENGDIKHKRFNNLINALQKDETLPYSSGDIELRVAYCGGEDVIEKEREQWNDGANVFAIDRGKVIGYERNRKTREMLVEKFDFEPRNLPYITPGMDLHEDYETRNRIKKTAESVFMDKNRKYYISLPGAELSKARGGPRCMTMPLERERIKW